MVCLPRIYPAVGVLLGGEERRSEDTIARVVHETRALHASLATMFSLGKSDPHDLTGPSHDSSEDMSIVAGNGFEEYRFNPDI
jgi:hypothetical protein